MSRIFQLPRQVPLVSGAVSPGAKANFFLTGTTTPTNTFTDSALGTPHANPVIANAAGEFATIYLDPDVVYKLTLDDTNDALIYTEDPIQDALTQENIGFIFYPRSADEISSGVTPTNFFEIYGNVRRYGAVGDGVTDDAPAFQSAIDALPSGGTVRFNRATFILKTGLDITGFDGGSKPIIFQGEGYQSLLLWGSTNAHAMIDLTGSTKITFRDCRIRGDTTNRPAIGILMGRDSAGSAGGHTLINVDVHGWFSIAGIYSVTSEENNFLSVKVQNNDNSATAYGYVTTNTVELGAVSQFATLTASNGNTNTSWFGGSISMENSTSGVAVRIRGANNVNFWGTYMNASGVTVVELHSANTEIGFHGIRQEGGATNSIQALTADLQDRIFISGCRLAGVGLRGENGAIFEELSYIRSNANDLLQIDVDILRNSDIQCSTLQATVRTTSENNKFWDIGSESNLTLPAGHTGTLIQDEGITFADQEKAITLVNGANNNIDIGHASSIRITGPSAAFSVSGFTGGYGGRRLTVQFAVAQTQTITNDATSTAANRLLTSTGADVVLTSAGGAMAEFIYSSVDSRWMLKNTQG